MKTHEKLVQAINEYTDIFSHDEVYSLLCKLAWVVWKELTQDEQTAILTERCIKWEENPKCFD